MLVVILYNVNWNPHIGYMIARGSIEPIYLCIIYPFLAPALIIYLFISWKYPADATPIVQICTDSHIVLSYHLYRKI